MIKLNVDKNASRILKFPNLAFIAFWNFIFICISPAHSLLNIGKDSPILLRSFNAYEKALGIM